MNFDFTNTEASTEFKPLEPGIYPATINGADWDTSKSNPNNRYLKVTFKCEGHTLYEYLNLVNTNEIARNIANGKTKGILTALGYTSFNFPNDVALAEAITGEISLKVGQKKEEYNGELVTKNIIKKFSPLSMKTPSAVGKDAGADLF